MNIKWRIGWQMIKCFNWCSMWFNFIVLCSCIHITIIATFKT